MQTLLKELNQIQAVADLQRELSKTNAVLRALKSGEISLDNLTIDGDAWKVEEVPPPVAPSGLVINSPAREDEVQDHRVNILAAAINENGGKVDVEALTEKFEQLKATEQAEPSAEQP